MEGSYSNILQAHANLPSPAFKPLVEQLAVAVR